MGPIRTGKKKYYAVRVGRGGAAIYFDWKAVSILGFLFFIIFHTDIPAGTCSSEYIVLAYELTI